MMEDLQLTIELRVMDTLREQFPQDRYYNHVSLKLIGEIGNEDIRFLSGYSDYYDVDPDTEKIIYYPERLRWNSLDLDLSEINPDDSYINNLNEIKALRSIILPKGYESVEWCYFWGDANDTTSSLTVSEGTKTIAKDSFNGWGMLEKVTFPNTLEEIAPEAFVGCSLLQSFDFSEGTDHFTICDGVLFSPDKTILIAFPPGLRIEKYEIPSGTTLIAERAFKQNPYIKEIFIPASVVRIQDYAFENCASLEKIEVDSANPIYYSRNGVLLEKGVPVLVPYQDIYFNERRNKMLCVPAAISRTKLNIKNILLAAKCFSGCKNIKTISYNGGNYSHRIDGVFDNCPDVEEISLTNVEVLPRLIDCQKLKKLNIEGEFDGSLNYSLIRNEELKEVYINKSWEYHTINGVVFNKNHELIFYPPAKEDEKYVVPENTLVINDGVFTSNPYLRTVVLPATFNLSKLKKEWHIDGYMDNGQSFIYHPCRGNDIEIRLEEVNASPSPKAKNVKHKGRKKKYEVKGIIIGTYEQKSVPIKISLYDDELEQIKALIRQYPESNDLRGIIEEDLPDLYDYINSELASAAYKYYEQEYMDYFAEGPDDEPGDIELTGEEYSCPIPEDWK
jgi:hypothetical protein